MLVLILSNTLGKHINKKYHREATIYFDAYILLCYLVNCCIKLVLSKLLTRILVKINSQTPVEVVSIETDRILTESVLLV